MVEGKGFNGVNHTHQTPIAIGLVRVQSFSFLGRDFRA